ncbi:protein NO VEIN domain-containing protein [Corynebacterium sp. AOP12-C2-36]|uniref:protein NO VEIN domain-containing protein n=1 Tax=Corynebacterium sp. AOP12-C2-36 TaxID=3457723 RepID=UPI0040340AF1
MNNHTNDVEDSQPKSTTKMSSARRPSVCMEIRRTGHDEGLGEDLYADKATEGASSRASYHRLMKLRTGDRILHWWDKALVGASTVDSDPVTRKGRARTTLRDFYYFHIPITLDDLRRQGDKLLDVRETTRANPEFSQFPFQINNADSDNYWVHGACTTYLVEFPPELLTAISGLSEQVEGDPTTVDDELEDQAPEGTSLSREFDPARRKAVEKYAEKLAIRAFQKDGYTLVGSPGKPYDLDFVKDGDHLHVEVKGSSTFVNSVILTKNEVTHASEFPTSLYVVDDINLEYTSTGYECSVGRERRWDTWIPASNSLSTLSYAYELPR